jgi:hypothetical protein
MKRTIKTILLLVFLAWIVVFLVGQIRWTIQLDQGWSPPAVVTSTENAYSGGGELCKWHDTLILVQSRYDWSSKSSSGSIVVRNNDSSNSWTQLPILSQAVGLFDCPALDPANDRIMYQDGYIESNELHMSAIFFRMAANKALQAEAERSWTRNQESLLGKTGPNVTLSEPAVRAHQPSRTYPGLGMGVLEDADVYVPYSLEANTFIPPNTTSDGPYSGGVFHSRDLGASWQLEPVSNFYMFNSSVYKTKANYYFLAFGQGALWFSLKSIENSLWDKPKAITKTVTLGTQGRYSATTEGDTVHICWLDNRHERWTFNLDHPGRGNYEVAYTRRKDSDASWHKAVILSRRIMFAYSPSISVEGDKVVVAWAGAQTAHAWPFEGDPSDIYYATSKDGGKTWSKPLQVTDHAQDGITSGSARVAVQNGVIYLFYAQGKYDRKAQVRNQGSWPVYYQQRPFPD